MLMRHLKRLSKFYNKYGIIQSSLENDSPGMGDLFIKIYGTRQRKIN